jgi:hypothetical protein
VFGDAFGDFFVLPFFVRDDAKGALSSSDDELALRTFAFAGILEVPGTAAADAVVDNAGAGVAAAFALAARAAATFAYARRSPSQNGILQ